MLSTPYHLQTISFARRQLIKLVINDQLHFSLEAKWKTKEAYFSDTDDAIHHKVK